jgi:hypothetical protein
MKNFEDLVKEAKLIFGDLYEYINIDRTEKKSKLIIKCKIHGEFKKIFNDHITRHQGCPHCVGRAKLNTDNFIERSEKINGNLYDYSMTNFKTTNTKVVIICKIHGGFEQTPKNHFKGQGCPDCSKYKALTYDNFVEKCKKIHNNNYSYEKVEFMTVRDIVNITCNTHGDYKQIAEYHLKGHGCYKCKDLTRNTEDFIIKANKLHDNIYDYSKVIYVSTHKKVNIICKTHGSFMQAPNDHLSGSGCNQCLPSNYSKECIKWLKTIEYNLGYKLQHAENKGEKQVILNNKIYRFDGYDEKTNTIYEYFGSVWHGNPNIYKPDDINPINKKSYGELYKKTIERLKILEENGYKIISIWDVDFKKK